MRAIKLIFFYCTILIATCKFMPIAENHVGKDLRILVISPVYSGPINPSLHFGSPWNLTEGFSVIGTLIPFFEEINFVHILREANHVADSLAIPGVGRSFAVIMFLVRLVLQLVLVSLESC